MSEQIKKVGSSIIIFGDIKIEVTNGEKSPKINISTKNNDLDVVLNNELIYSTYESEEFKHVPLSMRSFIKEHSYSMDALDKSAHHQLACELMFQGEAISAYFSSNHQQHVLFRYDDLMSFEDAKEELGELQVNINEDDLITIQQSWHTLQETIGNEGYSFIVSHSSDAGRFAWWDISFSPSKWNEEKIEDITVAITAYRKVLHKYLK